MKNKKAIVLSVIAVITLLALIIGATYAYFQASGGTGLPLIKSVVVPSSDKICSRRKIVLVYCNRYWKFN